MKDTQNIKLEIPLNSTIYMFEGELKDEVIYKSKILTVQLSYFAEDDKIRSLYWCMIRKCIHSKKKGFVVGSTAPACTMNQFKLGENLFLTKEDVKRKLKEIREGNKNEKT